MYELVLIDNLVLIIASALVYARNKNVGSFLIATTGVVILKDLNIQHFSGMNFDKIGYVKYELILSSAVIASAQGFILLIGLIFGYGSTTFGRNFVNNVANISCPTITKCILFLLCAFLLMSGASKAGMVGWFLDPRYGYEEARAGIGPLYALYLSLVGFTALVIIWRHSNNIPIYFSSLIILCCFAYLSGNKGLIIETFLYSLIFIIIYRLKLPLTTILILSVSCIYLYLQFINFITQSLPGFLFIANGYFDHTKNSIFVLQNTSRNLFNLTDFVEGLLIENIPRRVWSEKPFFYGDGFLTKQIYDADPGKNFGFLRQVWPLISGGIPGLMISGFTYFKFFLLGVTIAWLRLLAQAKQSGKMRKLSLVELFLVTTFIVFLVPNILGISGFAVIRFLIGIFCFYLLLYIGLNNKNDWRRNVRLDLRQ